MNNQDNENFDLWQLENDDDSPSSNPLNAVNINKEIPPSNRKDFIWPAIRASFEISSSEEEVFHNIKQWNLGNDPRVPDKELLKITAWALRNWDNKFRNALPTE